MTEKAVKILENKFDNWCHHNEVQDTHENLLKYLIKFNYLRDIDIIRIVVMDKMRLYTTRGFAITPAAKIVAEEIGVAVNTCKSIYKKFPTAYRQ